MTRAPLQLTLLAVSMLSLAAPANADAPASRNPNSVPANLTPAQIFDKSKAAYAALTTYTDEGTILALLNGLTMTTTFKIKLARPNLYRIDWTQTNDSPSSTTITKSQSVWSAGDGDFLDAFSQGPKKKPTRKRPSAAPPAFPAEPPPPSPVPS